MVGFVPTWYFHCSTGSCQPAGPYEATYHGPAPSQLGGRLALVLSDQQCGGAETVAPSRAWSKKVRRVSLHRWEV